MKNKISVVFVFLFMFFISINNSFSQQLNPKTQEVLQKDSEHIKEYNNSIKDLITRTEVSIYKAQKEMIAGHSQNKQVSLSNAIQYQVIAVEAFKLKDFSKAMCFSSKAREYTIEILTELKLPSLNYYLLSSEEKLMRIKNNCSVSETLIPVLINDSILMSPDLLRTTYKISLN